MRNYLWEVARPIEREEVLIMYSHFRSFGKAVCVGADYQAVRAADRVPRSLCHDNANFFRVNRRSGKATEDRPQFSL
jgi:hypothetical protein